MTAVAVVAHRQFGIALGFAGEMDALPEIAVDAFVALRTGHVDPRPVDARFDILAGQDCVGGMAVDTCCRHDQTALVRKEEMEYAGYQVEFARVPVRATCTSSR